MNLINLSNNYLTESSKQFYRDLYFTIFKHLLKNKVF